MIESAIAFFERSTPRVVLLVCTGLLIGMGVVDLAAGPRISLAVFYLFPVALAAGFVGEKAGIGLSIAAAAIALLPDLLLGTAFSDPVVPVWNSIARLAAFVAVALLAAALRRALREQHQMEERDSLTGLKRSELFYELVSRQVGIAVRYDRPLTLAYIGVDSFNALNQKYGRQTGDAVLVSIARTLRQNLRDTDIVARLGGDEFGVFFPETGSDRAKPVLEKVLHELGDAIEGWPISFSMGAVVCDHTACDLDELVRRAEGLMRRGKQSRVNNYEMEVLEPETRAG